MGPFIAAGAIPAPLRFVAVPDDHLEPSLRRGDFILLQPVETFSGEGVYLVRSVLGDLASFHVDAALKPSAPGVRLSAENPRYPTIRHFTIADFASIVVGKALMTCRVIGHRLHNLCPMAA